MVYYEYEPPAKAEVCLAKKESAITRPDATQAKWCLYNSLTPTLASNTHTKHTHTIHTHCTHSTHMHTHRAHTYTHTKHTNTLYTQHTH